ncbi:uncharacterized protein JN550_006487 [Neoarthrinium moseri]|uniref:uncharacterized protein n=1 Tax=Neoarthrinium moseri TaxID=1658444 RepID=UPI001FDCCAE3|nr:uncharacterized protein JN550_006487 [Neoarthrinium moseri]KAI1868571.1 hypothetical protein JN550_006487 [Neoarthrinium moseri]
MSGVRNLRAMFEQKGGEPGNSPPDDRGRSPGPNGLASFGSPTPSQSPRPLSKVRTSFVAVEKDGRIGLRREPSGDSISVSSRRMSNETESTTPAALPDKSDPFTDSMAKNAASFKTNLSNHPIPESPRQDSPASFSPKKGTETPEVTHGPNPDKIVDEEETRTKLTPADPTVKAAVNGKLLGLDAATEAKDKHKDKAKSTATVGKPAPRATPISTSSKAAAKPLKSPSAPAPAPKAPAKDAAKGPEKKPAAPVSKGDTPKKAAAPAPKPTTSSGKKPAALELSPSSTGFVKPKPKSPTRPVKLPSSLTAPTAASASRLGGSNAAAPKQPASHASGSLGVPASSHRPSSRTSTSTAGTVTAGKTLKRQSSTINRPRPSLGPPPKPAAKDHPVARKESQADDSFLARMMRPTQASSSKTHDKTTPVTPPRKQSAPSTVKKPASRDGEGSAKRATAKVAEVGKPKETIKKPTVGKGTPAKAKDATKMADTTKDTAAPAIAEPTTKAVAPVVAQAESAEEVIEAAAISKDTAITPVVEKQEEEEEEEEEEAQSVPVAAAVDKPAVDSAEKPLSMVEAPEVTKEPAVAKEPAVVKERPAESADEASSSQETAAAAEQSPAATVPAVTADPEKVEDIEDVIHLSSGKPVEEDKNVPEHTDIPLEKTVDGAISEAPAASEEPKTEGAPNTEDVETVTA